MGHMEKKYSRGQIHSKKKRKRKSEKECKLDKASAVTTEIIENNFPQLTEDLRFQGRTQELRQIQIYENKQINPKTKCH